MKTVVLDSPYQDTVNLPAIGKTLQNGVETPLTDEDAAIALLNPHVRLATDTETPTQKAQREQNSEFVTKIDESDDKPVPVVPAPAKPIEATFPTPTPASVPAT